jgi:glycosyltransferase involved in cell wall biosynthesis
MNVLLISDAYPPDIRSISLMVKELAIDLTKKGHSVTMVCFWPRYNMTEEALRRHYPVFSIEEGVEVLRVKTPPHKKVNFLVRGVSELLSPLLLWSAIKRHVKKKFDAVIVYSPPLPLSWVGYAARKQHGANFLLCIQDIFPQNAIDLGIMKNKLLIRFFEYLEAKSYHWADKLASHTKSSRQFLIQKKRIPPEKVELISNWIDIGPYVRADNSGKFRRMWGLEDRFIFLFAGIIGPSQNLDQLNTTAHLLRDFKDIVFLFVGDGLEKERLVRQAESLKLDNVVFKPFISTEQYPYLVKEADVGLISLSNRNRTPVVPGKILGYMAASLPVLAFLNEESDGHALIHEAQCGISAVSDSPDHMAQTILRMYSEKEKLPFYGRNGFNYVSEHFQRDKCIDLLVKSL